MRFPITAAEQTRRELAALNQKPPAIVQAAEVQKDWRYYEQTILNAEQNVGKLYREYKECGAWKEHYKTWADACEPLGKSRSQVDRLIHNVEEISAECAKVDHKKEQKALSQVEQAREEPQEEEEKPAVHSADEKKRDEPKPRNNGKVETVKDDLGQVVPQRCLELVSRSDEVQEHVTMASSIRVLLRKARETKDNLYSYLYTNLDIATDHADALYQLLRDCKPDRVCPKCDGKGGNCTICEGSGMISEYRWNHTIVNGRDPKLADKAKAIQARCSS